MDGMCFDYDHYFPEETFVIDDFGEICEDIVRIASASSQYLCKDFDNELRHDSPPPGSFIASNRCFEKEVPSLFSEMEYLTEVSPETDMILADRKSITVAVNPTEFSCKHQDKTTPKAYIEGFLEESPCRSPDLEIAAPGTTGKKTEESVSDTDIDGNLTSPTDYQRILNNYLQKGRRKLEASSYQKMKASGVSKEKMNALSTSAAETVRIASLLCQGYRTDPAQSFARNRTVPHRGNKDTAIVHRRPLPTTDVAIVLPSSTADNALVRESRGSSKLPPCPTLPHSMLNRTAAGSLKTVRVYLCQDCNFSFPSGELLRKHTCIIAEQYQCHLCLREFKKRRTLEHHMKSHDKVFSTDDDLRVQVKPYSLASHQLP